MSRVPRTGKLDHFLLRAEAGAAGGLAGAVAVALLFLLEGAFQLHQPLAVPTALTSAWFAGASGSTGAASGWGSDILVVLQFLVYTIMHLFAFAAVGVSAALVLDGSAFWKSVVTGAVYVGAACTVLLYIVSWVTDSPVALDVLGLKRVLLANMLAGAIIGIAFYVVEHGGEGEQVRA